MTGLCSILSIAVLALLCLHIIHNASAKKTPKRHQKSRLPAKKLKAEVQYIEVSEEEYPGTSRQRRSSDDLMKRFLKSYKNPGLSGDVMYIARRDMMLQFNLDENLLSESNAVHSELHIFKKAPKKLPKQKDPSGLPHARVTVQQAITEHRILGDTKVLASKTVNLNGTGWSVFDVTKAIKQ